MHGGADQDLRDLLGPIAAPVEDSRAPDKAAPEQHVHANKRVPLPEGHRLQEVHLRRSVRPAGNRAGPHDNVPRKVHARYLCSDIHAVLTRLPARTSPR